jgi:hypothetical protein
MRKNNFFKKISAVISNMEIIAEKKTKKKNYARFMNSTIFLVLFVGWSYRFLYQSHWNNIYIYISYAHFSFNGIKEKELRESVKFSQLLLQSKNQFYFIL